jgi:hypothetical protein
MARRSQLFLTILIVLLTGLFPVSSVKAFPALPSSFYGEVTVNGMNFSDGTLVQALINDQPVAQGYTQTYQDCSVYSLDVPGDDPATAAVEGGKDGDIVQIKVGGVLAGQTGVWHSGSNVELDLTVTSQASLAAPQVTPTGVPTQTPLPTSLPPTLTSTATSVPPTAEPQTDPGQDPAPTSTYPAVSASQAQPPVESAETPAAAAPALPTAGPVSSGAATITPLPVTAATQGSDVSPKTAGAAAAAEPAGQTNSSLWLLVVVCVLVVAGGLFGAWSAFSSKKRR